MMRIEFASVGDTEEIMRFLHEHWRSSHVMSRSRDLFLYDFQNGERLNMAVSRDANGALTGLFGFMFYNGRPLPDLAGSLWKVAEHVKEPMLGLKLRNFVMENIPHRFFAAPGAGLQTRSIYKVLKMAWHRMHQYYLLNPEITSFELASVPPGLRSHYRVLEAIPEPDVEEIHDPGDLKDFQFDADPDLGPMKDWGYVRKRFFRHPVYRYNVFALRSNGSMKNIIVCRKAHNGGRSACRVVDFYGDEAVLPSVAAFLYRYIIQNDCEYADFICHGFDLTGMERAGFSDLDVSRNDVVIPNYFEPFEKKNVPVYCVAEKKEGIRFRQVRADGDQDRPNKLPGDRE